MSNGAIETILWPGLHALEPHTQLGGILARKPGYHNSRDHLPNTDYSVREFLEDRYGPVNLGSAIDWTFPDAQAGNYATINKYSNRLMNAGKLFDPRTAVMREFFGNTDTDHTVEGWDFSKRVPTSSDSSHLWHIHISIHRKYINDGAAMKAILDILAGTVYRRPSPAPKTKTGHIMDWNNETVQAINFFFAEAYRAEQGKADKPYPASGTPTTAERADRAARNAYVYTSHVDGVDPE